MKSKDVIYDNNIKNKSIILGQIEQSVGYEPVLTLFFRKRDVDKRNAIKILAQLIEKSFKIRKFMHEEHPEYHLN